MNHDNTEWSRLYSDQEILVYMGFTKKGKAYGSGTAFYKSGAIYQEGVFGVKGLLCGREYYPSGQLRFEGVYTLNKGYGPNYPQCGRFFDQIGNLLYEGKLTYKISGLGWPLEAREIELDRVVQKEHPDIAIFTWQDAEPQ